MSSVRTRNHLAAVGAGSALAALLALACVSSATAAPHTAQSTKAAAALKPCTGGTTKVTASAVRRPVNHLLLRASNTSKKTCAAYSAPALRFDTARYGTPVEEDSAPRSVVVLRPGRSAYASVTLSGEHTAATAHGHIAKKLEVWFMPRAAEQGAVRPAAHPALPKNTYTDDDAQVSYWQHSAADALVR